MRASGLLLAALCGGCAAQTPREALDAYVEAVRSGDAGVVWAMSDAGFRATHDREAVRAMLESPDERAKLAARLSAPEGSERQRAVLELPGGARVSLVFEAGKWRVSAGGVEPASCATPELALRSLFRGVASGRLEELRCTIPGRFASQLASDEALASHVVAMRPRVEAARALVPAEPAIEVDGDRAVLTYAPGRAVRFEREGGTWRVVDVE